MKKLALLYRDRRDQTFVKWQEQMKDLVTSDYREVLESPIGLRLVGSVIEAMVDLSQAEPYEIAGVRRKVEAVTQEEAGRRARLGFELDDIMAGMQAMRLAFWSIVVDAIVTGDLPPAGETMDGMRQVDAFLDMLVRAEVRGYLAYVESTDKE